MSEALYLIRKGGAYYRPNSQGYTRLFEEAGRYTLEEAEAITHPNGSDGPRDGMDYVEAPATEKAAPIPAEVLALADKIARQVATSGKTGRVHQIAYEPAKEAAALAVMQDRADREARPSLPDSREEQIREDERQIIARVIRRIAQRFEPRSASQNNHRALADAIESGDAFSPTARARQGGNNG